MDRPAGMLPAAFQRYLHCCDVAGVHYSAIVQTVGNAPASAGFHAADGTFINDRGIAEPYCAATDISVLRPHKFSTNMVSRLLMSMFHGDFVPFWRHAPQWEGAPHLHVIWPACYMKAELIGQVHSWMAGRDGLADGDYDLFWHQFIDDIAWTHQVARVARIMDVSNAGW